MSKHYFFSENPTGLGAEAKVSAEARFQVHILLTHGFSLLSFASMTDVFDAVKLMNPRSEVQVRILSADGDEVFTRSGGRVLPDAALEISQCARGSGTGPDLFIVCSGPEMGQSDQRVTMSVVRHCRRASVPVCVMGSAVRAVAMSGHISRGTDHWTRLPANNEMATQVEFSNAIFVEDSNITCCSGELGAMDFALDWVSSRVSANVSARIRNFLLVSSARSANRAQTCTVADTYKCAPKRLQDIIGMMLQNLEDPVPVASLAGAVGLSTRQVERLFALHLSTSPLKFYRARQLEQAKILIEDTNMSMTEIAIACGFSSLSRFARAFRKRYGVSARALRSASFPHADAKQPGQASVHGGGNGLIQSGRGHNVYGM